MFQPYIEGDILSASDSDDIEGGFAVNVKTNKEAIELQKLAFKYGYKWKPDPDYYNNIDENMMQYYKSDTYLIFRKKNENILFSNGNFIIRFKDADRKLAIFSYKENYSDIINNFEIQKKYIEKKHFDNSLMKSTMKERIIL